MSRARACLVYSQWPTEQTHVAEYPSLYPNVLLGFQADHAFAVILTPMTPHSTREEVRIFYVGEGRDGGCVRGVPERHPRGVGGGLSRGRIRGGGHAAGPGVAGLPGRFVLLVMDSTDPPFPPLGGSQTGSWRVRRPR